MKREDCAPASGVKSPFDKLRGVEAGTSRPRFGRLADTQKYCLGLTVSITAADPRTTGIALAGLERPRQLQRAFDLVVATPRSS